MSSTSGTKCVKAGDVNNVILSGTCFSTTGRLRSLLQGGGTGKANGNLNMPPAVTSTEATANNAAFKAASEASYIDGPLGQSFGITGATSTIEDPVFYDDDDDNSLALGLGLGLGLGIPVVVAIIAAVIIIHKRRENQTVGQSSTTPADNQA